jgi:hypothetical protein
MGVGDVDTGLPRNPVTPGIAASTGFGMWHSFVPRSRDWYAYIDPAATELVKTVRAINAFFSLSLAAVGPCARSRLHEPRTAGSLASERGVA